MLTSHHLHRPSSGCRCLHIWSLVSELWPLTSPHLTSPHLTSPQAEFGVADADDSMLTVRRFVTDLWRETNRVNAREAANLVSEMFYLAASLGPAEVRSSHRAPMRPHGTPTGPPRDPHGTPRDPHGTPWDPMGPHGTPRWDPMGPHAGTPWDPTCL